MRLLLQIKTQFSVLYALSISNKFFKCRTHSTSHLPPGTQSRVNLTHQRVLLIKMATSSCQWVQLILAEALGHQARRDVDGSTEAHHGVRPQVQPAKAKHGIKKTTSRQKQEDATSATRQTSRDSKISTMPQRSGPLVQTRPTARRSTITSTTQTSKSQLSN